MTPFEIDFYKELKGQPISPAARIMARKTGEYFERYGQQQLDDRQSFRRRHEVGEA